MPSDLPERTAQAHGVENRSRLISRWPTKITAQAAAVPRLRKRPRVIQRHHEPARQCPSAAPAIDVLFRPEEQDVRSRIDDVIPETRGRHEQVDDSVAEGRAAAHAACNGLTRPGARAVDVGIGMKRRWNAERVPRARREPRSALCVHSKPIRHRRKRRRGPQSHRAGPKDDDVAFGERTKQDLCPRPGNRAGMGDVARRGSHAVFDNRFVDRLANRPHLVVRRHQTPMLSLLRL